MSLLLGRVVFWSRTLPPYPRKRYIYPTIHCKMIGEGPSSSTKFYGDLFQKHIFPKQKTPIRQTSNMKYVLPSLER